MVEISKRIQQMAPSGTVEMSQKVREMQSQERDVISLSVGEPDFATPLAVKEAAVAAIREDKANHYTAATGIVPLKKAIIDFHNRKDGLDYELNQVAVFSGAKFTLYTAFQTLLDPGDEVLIPAPYWVSYTEQIKLAQGTPVIVETNYEDNFKVTVQQLEAQRTDKTKILLLTSPSNPTGTFYTRDELTTLGQWAVDNDLLIISDEIYYELMYDNHHSVSIASISPEVQAHTLIVNGLSKSSAMTGWRVGYALGDAGLIKAMADLTTHTTGNLASVSQYAAIAALSSDNDAAKEEMRQKFEDRLELFYPLISEIPGFKCHKAGATFYLFVDVTEAAKRCGYDSVRDFCMAILEEAEVALVSGDDFGAPDYLRFSFATSDDLLVESARRIKTFVESKWK